MNLGDLGKTLGWATYSQSANSINDDEKQKGWGERDLFSMAILGRVTKRSKNSPKSIFGVSTGDSGQETYV